MCSMKTELEANWQLARAGLCQQSHRSDGQCAGARAGGRHAVRHGPTTEGRSVTHSSAMLKKLTTSHHLSSTPIGWYEPFFLCKESPVSKLCRQTILCGVFKAVSRASGPPGQRSSTNCHSCLENLALEPGPDGKYSATLPLHLLLQTREVL